MGVHNAARIAYLGCGLGPRVSYKYPCIRSSLTAPPSLQPSSTHHSPYHNRPHRHRASMVLHIVCLSVDASRCAVSHPPFLQPASMQEQRRSTHKRAQTLTLRDRRAQSVSSQSQATGPRLARPTGTNAQQNRRRGRLVHASQGANSPFPRARRAWRHREL